MTKLYYNPILNEIATPNYDVYFQIKENGEGSAFFSWFTDDGNWTYIGDL